MAQMPRQLYTDNAKITSYARGISPYFNDEDDNKEFIRTNSIWIMCITTLMIYKKNMLDSYWLSAVQFKCNTS